MLTPKFIYILTKNVCWAKQSLRIQVDATRMESCIQCGAAVHGEGSNTFTRIIHHKTKYICGPCHDEEERSNSNRDEITMLRNEIERLKAQIYSGGDKTKD